MYKVLLNNKLVTAGRLLDMYKFVNDFAISTANMCFREGTDEWDTMVKHTYESLTIVKI